jgi:hypothetical protein
MKMKKYSKYLAILAFVLLSLTACTNSNRYDVTITNVDDNQAIVLGNGVLVLHESDASFNFKDLESPESLRALLESNDPQPLVDKFLKREDALEVITINQNIAFNEKSSFKISAPIEEEGGVYVTGFINVLASDDESGKYQDAFVFVPGVGIYSGPDYITPMDASLMLVNFDGGLDEGESAVGDHLELNYSIAHMEIMPR